MCLQDVWALLPALLCSVPKSNHLERTDRIALYKTQLCVASYIDYVGFSRFDRFSRVRYEQGIMLQWYVYRGLIYKVSFSCFCTWCNPLTIWCFSKLIYLKLHSLQRGLNHNYTIFIFLFFWLGKICWNVCLRSSVVQEFTIVVKIWKLSAGLSLLICGSPSPQHSNYLREMD